eukprot:6706999-Alexandrium_andersonii.AAC.1
MGGVWSGAPTVIAGQAIAPALTPAPAPPANPQQPQGPAWANFQPGGQPADVPPAGQPGLPAVLPASAP